MKTLITAERVYALTFSTEEPYSASAITEADIVEAESRYLMPIVGEEFYKTIASYTALKTEYVEPMLAAWVRYIVEPHLAARCCTCYAEGRVTEAVNDHTELVLRALRDKAVALNTVILAEQEQLLEPIRHIISELFGVDASSLAIINTPPVYTKPNYMRVWEARKADGLDYDENDPAQQLFLAELARSNNKS